MSGGVDQVDAGAADAIADAAAEAARAAVGVDVAAAGDSRAARAKGSGGGGRRRGSACRLARRSCGGAAVRPATAAVGLREVHRGLRGQTGWLPACVLQRSVGEIYRAGAIFVSFCDGGESAGDKARRVGLRYLIDDSV